MFTKKTSLALAAFMIPLFAGSSLSTHAGDAAPTPQEMKKGTGMAQPSRKIRDASSWIKQPKEETSSEKTVREAREERMKELDAIRAARKQAGGDVKSPSHPSSTQLKPSEKADPSYGLKSTDAFPKMGRTQQALVNKMDVDSNEAGGKASSPSAPHHDSNVTAPSSTPSHHAPKVEHEKIVTDLPMPHKAQTPPAHHADHADSSTSEHGLTPTEESPRMGNLQKQLIERMKQRKAAAAQKTTPDVPSKAHSAPHALPPLEITPEEEAIHMGRTERKLIDSMKAKKVDDASQSATHDAPSKAHSAPHALPPLEITPEEEAIHMGRTERKLIDSMKEKKADDASHKAAHEGHSSTTHHYPDVTVPSSAPTQHPKLEMKLEEHEEIVTDLTMPHHKAPTAHDHQAPKVEHEEITTTLKSPLKVEQEETVTLTLPPKAPPPPPAPLVKPAHPVTGESTLDQITKGAAGLKKVDAPTEPRALSSHEEAMAKIKGGKFNLKRPNIVEDLPSPAPKSPSSEAASSGVAAESKEKATMDSVADQIKKGGFNLKKVDRSQPHPAQGSPQEKEAEQQLSDPDKKRKVALFDELKAKAPEGKFEFRKKQAEQAPDINLDEVPAN